MLNSLRSWRDLGSECLRIILGPHAFVFAGGSREGTVEDEVEGLSLAASPLAVAGFARANIYALAPQIPPATQATC